MAEDDFDLVSYKDISEIRKELDGVKAKKDFSQKDLYEEVHKLNETIKDMLEIFSAAAEQVKLEEKQYESEAKKHETIITKLDKLIDQNKTIAEAMVGIVGMLKEKFVSPMKEREESTFQIAQEPMLFSGQKPFEEPKPFMRPQRGWEPKPEPIMNRTQPIPMNPMAIMPAPNTQLPLEQNIPDFGTEMPPMQPTPPPDLDFPVPFPLEEEPKKKGIFGMFKKQ